MNTQNIIALTFFLLIIITILIIRDKKMKKKKDISLKQDINTNNDIDNETSDITITSVEDLKQDIQSKMDNLETMPNNIFLSEDYENYLLPPHNLICEETSKLFLEGIISDKNKTSIFLGFDENGKLINIDITKLPNLLICGTVMTGKTSLVNCIICNLLMKCKPNELKFILIDTKMINLINYNGIPNLMVPVITDLKKASLVLQKLCIEIEKRYKILSEKCVKNIVEYNRLIEKENKMNYLIVIIDEFSNLMLVAKNEVNYAIEYIAKLGHSVGIHCILVTNNPSNSSISYNIKSLFPSKVSFKMTTKAESKLLLDETGAEILNQTGVCLYKSFNTSHSIKVTTPFIDDMDINRIVKFVSSQYKANYDSSLEIENSNVNVRRVDNAPSNDDIDEPLYDEVVKFAIETGTVSASLLQKRFRLGYHRAARIVDLLEANGIVGQQNGLNPREVLIKSYFKD